MTCPILRLLWILVWVANILLAGISQFLLRRTSLPLIWACAIAILPALPMAFGLVLFIAILRRMDEFRRKLAITTFALASAIVGIIVYGWSLLAFVGMPALPPVWILPAQLTLWSALMVAARWHFP